MHAVLEPPFEVLLVSNLAELGRSIFGTIDDADLAWRLTRLPDASVQVVTNDDRLVAFKLGYGVAMKRYRSWVGGVAPAFRRQGLARAMLTRQHAWGGQRGYTLIETATDKHNTAMLSLNLAAGFEIVGSLTRETSPRVLLQKRLSRSPPMRP